MRVANLLMMFVQRYPVFLLFILVTFFNLSGSAQCVHQYPYSEDFENNDGSWLPGGTASDWAWGKPAKAIIKQAVSGQKCWIVGGLTGNFYNQNEKSWLQSPCFDFTGLVNPYVSFFINWDTETDYDGAALQYSVNNGTSWQSAGTYGDVALDCGNNNWYNNPNVQRGVQAAGWCGTGNDGSRGWVLAYHSFPQLAGNANVLFRFVFGAGDKRNNYDGFAVDNIYIGETVSNKVVFTYSCNPAPRQVTFAAPANGCIDASSIQWNFDDVASGNNNVSGGTTTVHTFSSANTYKVTFTAKNNRNETVTDEQNIIIPNVTVAVKTPVACYGGMAVAEASVTNISAAISYVWSTNPVITTASAQLKAGIYLVTATAAGGCSNSAPPVNVTEPGALGHDVQIIPADCNNQNGSLSITEDGGTPPYRYTWQGTQYSTPSANNLPSGNYSIRVTDQNDCVDNVPVSLPLTISSLSQRVETILPDCGLSNGSITVNTDGGVPDYSYEWKPAIAAGNVASDVAPGNYTVIATDKLGCHDTSLINLSAKPLTVSLGSDTFVCKGQALLLKPAGNYANYLWNDGSVTSTKSVDKAGNYSLTVTNAGGCQARDTIKVSVGCGDLVFPSVFTPNGDGMNEQFGPSGGLSLVTSYHLLLYNRFGNLVYQSMNPYQKWSGVVNGRKLTGTYTYVVTYVYDGEKKMKKGTIVLFL